jgi:hypothetical protein
MLGILLLQLQRVSCAVAMYWLEEQGFTERIAWAGLAGWLHSRSLLPKPWLCDEGLFDIYYTYM